MPDDAGERSLRSESPAPVLAAGWTNAGCRHCYDLRHQSCQTHDKRVDVLAKDLRLLRFALEGPDVGLNLLGIAALEKVLRRLKRRGRWA